jgi:TM2 domain-containing membrane protein YozV
VTDSDSDNLRVGTVERESAVKVLSEHMSEGRLSIDEYEERMSAALEARTRADLKVLFRDLPAPYPWFMAPPSPSVPALPPPSGLPVFVPSAPLPVAGQSERYRVVAGVLQIVFPFGVGRFYTGHTAIGLAQLVTMFIGVGVIWSIIDGIIMLATGGTDAEGRPLRM